MGLHGSTGRCGRGEDDGGFLERLLASLASPAELAQAAQPRMPLQSLRVLAQFMHNDLLLASMGVSKEVGWLLPSCTLDMVLARGMHRTVYSMIS